MARYVTLRLIFLALFVQLVTVVPVHSTDDDHAAVRVGIGALKPYAFERDGKMVGILPDTYSVLSSMTNLEFRYSYVTSSRVLFRMEKGDIDIAMFYRMPWLNANVIPLVKISELTNMAIGLKGLDICSREDLKSLTIAVMRGGTFEREFAGHPEIDPVLTIDYEQSVKLLLSGRVDAVIGIAESLLYNLQEAGVHADQLGRPLIYGRGEVWAHLSQVSPLVEQQEEIKAALQEIVDTGLNMQFRERYLNAEMMTLLREIAVLNAE